jgi:hypothetical protein
MQPFADLEMYEEKKKPNDRTSNIQPQAASHRIDNDRRRITGKIKSPFCPAVVPLLYGGSPRWIFFSWISPYFLRFLKKNFNFIEIFSLFQQRRLNFVTSRHNLHQNY